MRVLMICVALVGIALAAASDWGRSAEAAIGGVSLNDTPEGTVKTVVIERAKFSGDVHAPGPGKRFLMKKALYDKRGNTTREEWFASEDSHSRTTLYRYDEHGNLVEVTDASPDVGSGRTTRHTYDEAGNRIETTSRDEKDTLNVRRLYNYDEAGRKRSEAHHGGDGSLRGTRTYFYDKAGRLEMSVAHRPDGTVSMKTTYQYDDAGHTTSVSVVNDKGAVLAKHGYKYGDKGVLSRAVFESDAGKSSVEYNKYGDEIAVVAFDDTGAVIEKSVRTFEFDKHGNWTKCTDSRGTPDKDGTIVVTPREVTYRAITYYTDTSK